MSFTNPEINPSSNAPLLTLGLIDSVTDQIVMGYEDLGSNQTININDLNLTNYNIAAFINSNHMNSNAVTSVKFESSLGNRTENVAPYALFGDVQGDYFGQPLAEGDYSFMATAYSGKNARGDVLGVVTVGYTVINSTTEPPLDFPSISISDASADENAKLATFTISLSETSNVPITVDYATADGTAIAGSDYARTSGTLTFAIGETSKTLSVALTDDTQFEEDEKFTLNLSNPSGGAIFANNTATGMIIENDLPPASVLDFSLPEDKIMEQKMLLRIVPDGSETHRAVKNGSWFDHSTWANGIIPTEGARVHIPAHLTVEYDGQSDVPLWTIRVDGNLNFSRTKESKLVVDTLAVMYSGQLNMGSQDQAINNNVKAEIVFADDQRSLDDPMAMGLGLVSIGEVNIHGQEKRSYLKVAKDPLKGDTSLNLAEVPVGWKVGDRIVLTGTKYNPDWSNDRSKSEDETLIITGINGQSITVDKPLQFDHDTPRADLKAYVANLSRNVILRSEETEDIAKRGHVMLMHNDNVDIRFAHFQELGRTDKSRLIDNNSDNVNGRYALHLHRQGVALDNNPAIVVGNSLEGSPGWGYVHHSSYAVMDHNVAYDVFGGAFIAESGDETGRWEHNIAIKGTGVGGREGNPKSAAGSLSAANNGTGFYFQGRLVHNQNNIAASMPGFGFLYFHRGTGATVGRVDSSTIEEPLTARYKSGVSIDSPTIQGFVNNEAFATSKGLEVIKNHANQHHDSRTILDGFLAWDIQNGVRLDYTGHYTLNDFDLIAHETSSAKYWSSAGLTLRAKIVDIVVNDLYVDGFYKGITIAKNNENNMQFNDLPGNNLFIDYEAVNVNVRMETNGLINGHVTEINSSEIQSRMVSLELDPTSDLHIDNLWGNERITMGGTKTDSAGTFTYGILESHGDLRNIHNMDLGSLLQKGYYTLPNDQKAIIFPELISDRIFGNSFVQDLVVTIGDSIKTDKLPYLGQLNATDANEDGIWEVNSAPHAAFDAVKIEKNSPVTFRVLKNDSDIDGDKITLQDFTNVGNGTLKLVHRKTGTFVYTPNVNHDGYDYFNYTIADPNGSGRTRTGMVQLKIETMD